MRKKISALLILLSVPFSGYTGVHAQTIETPDYTTGEKTVNASDLLLSEKIPGLQEQIDFQVNPEKPKPGEEVEISVNMYSLNINTVPILWKINDKEYAKGSGLKKIKFRVGESGERTSVTAIIFLKSGKTYKKDIIFSPFDVDILWQAKTYTPPFYKGKALYTPESEVEFTAIPNMYIDGKKIDPDTVVYTWYKDYELDNENSGFGKKTYNFKGPIILKDILIQNKLYVSSDQTVQGSNRIKLSHMRPEALFYEESPSLGFLFNKAITGEYKIGTEELKLSSFPFFFSTKNRNLLLTYTWNMDGRKINLPSYQSTTIFKKTSQSEGSATINLIINNPTHILQKSSSVLRLKYEK